MKQILVDIFNDDIKSSKTSFYVNSSIIFLIVLSTLEIILETENSLQTFQWLFDFVYFFTSVLFLIEIVLRYYISGYLDSKYRNAIGKLKFTFNFYTIVDIVSVFPFVLGVFGFEEFLYLKAFRVLRIFKFFRYFPSVGLLQRSVLNKKNELLISLQVIFILVILLSIGLYYSENRVPASPFSSIFESFLWSISKFIGGIGGYGLYDPVTSAGKLLATLNGILGIAIFALPAGIIASGFVDEIGEVNKKKEIENNKNRINKYFDRNYSSKASLDGKKTHIRYMGLDSIQAATLLTEQEIFNVLRNTNTFRFRSMKSSTTSLFNDMKIVERFFVNTSYGYKKKNENSNIHLVCPLGNVERGISHFAYTISELLECNYYIRELEIPYNDTNIGSFTSDYHTNYLKHTDCDYPIAFMEWIGDLSQIKKDDIVVVLLSGASGGPDFDIEYGLPKDTEGLVFEESYIYRPEIIISFYEKISSLINSVTVTTQKKTTEQHSFNCLLHSKGDASPKNLSHLIHKLTSSNVFCIYVNIKILTGDNGYYYAALTALVKSLEVLNSINRDDKNDKQ
ncbi:MAG: ion transporter [Bacteroidales bacterium]|nr:ion transporter [Bacteroidales bacterium]